MDGEYSPCTYNIKGGISMYKKLISGSLALGLLLTGGTGVMAAEHPTPAKKILNFNPAASSAYTSVTVSGAQVTLSIGGLDNPFTSKYYKAIAWTTGGEPNVDLNNTIRTREPGNTTSVTLTLKELQTKLNGNDKVYGWARAANGFWYPCGYGVLSVD